MNVWRILLRTLIPVVVFGVASMELVDPGSPTDALLALQSLLGVTLLLLLFVFLREIPRITRIASPICDEPQGGALPTNSWLAFATGLALVAAVLWLEEHRQPFFFTQDDNLAQFLPVMLEGGRASLRGIFPTWNAYQFLGAPTASLGVYALTYPLTYACYYFSRFLLGNEFLTLEVFCIVHLVAGYAAMYWAARKYEVRPWLAAAAGASAVLSGWALIASRSWYYVSEIFVYMPVLVIAVRSLQQGRAGWKWIAFTGLAIGAFFHAGNAQFWAYGLIFFWIALSTLWWANELTHRDIFRAASATLIGIGISAPLLIPQLLQTHGVKRIINIYTGELRGDWLSYFIPGPWVHQDSPSDWIDPAWKTGSLIVYSGTTFFALTVLLLLALLSLHFSRKRIAANAWALCALLAFFCGLGSRGVLWPIMVRLPLFNNFRQPFKFIAFLDVFAIVAGVIVCERVLRRLRSPGAVEAVLVAFTFAMVVAGCTFSLPSWYTYNFRPYPDASRITQRFAPAMQNQYRVVSLARFRSRSPLFWEGMPLNLATNYQVLTPFGYDPLVELQPEFLTLWRQMSRAPASILPELGVRYFICPNDFSKPRLGPYPAAWMLESAGDIARPEIEELIRNSTTLFRDQEVTIGERKGARPVAYLQTDPDRPLPLSIRADGFDVDTSRLSQGGRVILNFYWYQGMHANADGKETPIGKDSLSRMVVNLRPGTHRLQVRFQPPWVLGSLLGLVVLVAGIGLAYFPAGRDLIGDKDSYLKFQERRQEIFSDRHDAITTWRQPSKPSR